MPKPITIHDLILIFIPIIFAAFILSHSVQSRAQASEPCMISVQACTALPPLSSTLGPRRIKTYRVNQESDLYDKHFIMDTRALSICPMITCLNRSTLDITPAALCGPTPPVQAEQHVLVLPCPSATLLPLLVLAVVPPMADCRREESPWRRNKHLDTSLRLKLFSTACRLVSVFCKIHTILI